MNATIDPQLEDKIVAYLDGEMSSDDSADLSRLVLKDPQARALLDEYQRNDNLANQAIEAIMRAANPIEQNTTALNAAPTTFRTWRWYGPVATAATLAIMTLGGFMVAPAMFGVLGLHDQNRTVEVADAGDRYQQGQLPAGTSEDNLNEARVRVASFRPDTTTRSDVPYTTDELDYGPQLSVETDSVMNTERSFFGLYDERVEKFYWLEVQHTEDEYEIIEADL